jgi:predicted esterase
MLLRPRPVTPLDENAIVWSCPEAERVGRPLVVLLHGFGGHESDWAAWFPALPDGTVGAAPRGPVAVDQRWAWADVAARGPTATALATASSRWLAEHTAAHFADFPDETHMLSRAFADGALRFTAKALGAGR